MKRILKWSVPIDDRQHPIGAGRVVFVAQQGGPVSDVQVWTEEPADSDDGTLEGVAAQVIGTGHPFSDSAEVVGSVNASPFVWHVIRFPK